MSEMTESDVINLIRDQFGILSEERGVIIPTSSIDKLPGAKNNPGVVFRVPNSTGGESLVMSNGVDAWNEFVNVGPVS